MIAAFDIFRIEAKSVRWLETAGSLEEAKKLESAGICREGARRISRTEPTNWEINY